MEMLYDCMNAMSVNDGSKTNRQALIDRIKKLRGEKAS